MILKTNDFKKFKTKDLEKASDTKLISAVKRLISYTTKRGTKSSASRDIEYSITRMCF